MNDHTRYLKRCIELGELSGKEGESAVGSVLVLNDVIIGEGREMSRQKKDITRHAEVVAILDAISKHGACKGAILYSNMEPCILCSYVIRHHQIATVVFSNSVGELGGTNPRFNILTTNEIKSWAVPPDVIIDQSL